MTNFDRAFIAAQRAHDNQVPDDEPDHLEDKPRGLCPWCDSVLKVDDDDLTLAQYCMGCDKYDIWETEDENRARYAEERAKEAELARRLNKEGVEW